jgi:hypothetical protein
MSINIIVMVGKCEAQLTFLCAASTNWGNIASSEASSDKTFTSGVVTL